MGMSSVQLFICDRLIICSECSNVFLALCRNEHSECLLVYLTHASWKTPLSSVWIIALHIVKLLEVFHSLCKLMIVWCHCVTGCAFVTLSSRQCAQNAIRSLHHSRTLEVSCATCVVWLLLCCWQYDIACYNWQWSLFSVPLCTVLCSVFQRNRTTSILCWLAYVNKFE